MILYIYRFRCNRYKICSQQVSSDSKPTPQEIMKRKMKVLLNKQCQ